jgi:hypothetical protein
MAYVSGYQHDVFVSYAHVDNEPLGDVDHGWISLLVQNIQTAVDRKLGRKGSCDIWMDYRLRKNEPFTPNIMDAVGKSATLLVVLSQGYLESPWCERERKTFREITEGRDPSSIFLVELDPLEDERPSDFTDLNGYRFWVKKPEKRAPRIMGFPKPDDDYWDAVLELCDELADALKTLKAGCGTGKSTHLGDVSLEPLRQRPERTVFLAQTTDDLWQDHKSVKDYLDQVGVGVVPRTIYPQDAEGFRAAAEKDLERCDVFVQLLSSVPDRMPDGIPQGYSRLQFELAQAAGKPILQWRSPALDVDKVKMAAVRDFLREPTVRAESIADFKNEVKKTVSKTAIVDPPGPALEKFFFVNRQPEDKKFSRTVEQILEGMGVDIVWTPEIKDVREYREFLEQALSTCNGMVLIHGRSPCSWVTSQLMQCRKSLAERPGNTLRSFAVCRFPPMPKEELNMKLRSLRVFDCNDDADGDGGGNGGRASRHGLHAFLQDLVATVQA